MCSEINNINDLKSKLQSVTRKRLRNEQMEHSLHTEARSLTENITLLRSESEFILQQMQELKQQISQAHHQISIIEICSASEKEKIQNHMSYIIAHNKSFEVFFTKDREQSELQNKKLLEQEALILEMNEQKNKEAAAIEAECYSLERECGVLTKRNKAILLKLRRHLIEAEDTRRELTAQNGILTNNMVAEN